VTVELVKERLTFNASTDDKMAALMMTMLAGFAQFERSLIRERQREGIAVAKANGVYRDGKARPNHSAHFKTRATRSGGSLPRAPRRVVCA
jgi:DNA invertase Pin-like site-specific DNA recombinase